MTERYYVKGLEVWRRPDPDDGRPETVRLSYLICTCSPIAGSAGAALIAKVLEASELIAKQLKVRRGEMYDGG